MIVITPYEKRADIEPPGSENEDRVDEELMNDLNELEVPQNIKYFFESYCIRTYPGKGKPLTWEMLINEYNWYRIECFCQFTRYLANPDGINSYTPDVQSLNRLEELSISLCDQLRNKKIQPYDAYYRFQQELNVSDEQKWNEQISGSAFRILDFLK